MESMLNALRRDWRALARSPRVRRRLRQWGDQEPALAGHHDLDQLLDGRYSGPGAAQPILLALARLATHDELAARTLLQALIPGLVRMARTRDADDPSASDELLAIAWVRIRTYPATRVGSVAANVLRDTQKEYRAHHTIEVPRSLELWTHDVPKHPSAEHEAQSLLLLHDLVAVMERGGVSGQGLGVVLLNRVADIPLSQLAAEEGVPFNVVANRRWRAERRLRKLPLAG